MTRLSLSKIHFPVTTLGPGKRIGLWLQGCSIRCPGCISLDTWDPVPGETTVGQILDKMATWSSLAEGLTISGGEPLDQLNAVAKLIEGWRAISDQSVLLFTGYGWNEAERRMSRHGIAADAVLAGPFDRRAGSTKALRGSDNQTLHVLSPRGEQFLSYERRRQAEDRKLDVMFDRDGSVWFAGIPEAGDFDRLRDQLRLDGHSISTSAHSREIAK